MNFKFLPKFMRPLDRSGDSSEDDKTSEDDYRGASEEEPFDDCISDLEPKSAAASPDNQKVAEERQPSSTENFVIATEAVVSSDGNEGRFVDLDSTDAFVQTTPFKSEKIPILSKVSTVHKNELQTLCQRNRIDLPTYTHVREGPAHAPKFKATVEVIGKRYTSSGNCSTKGEAEQAAAKEALSILNQPDNTRDNTPTLTVAGSQSNFDSSNASACTADSSVRMKNVKSEGQIRTCAGLTIETPIDLTEDEQSVGSSPPLSTASSPACNNARVQSAARSYQQLWGGNKDITTVRGASMQTKKPTTSDKGAAPAGLDNNVGGIAGQFSGLQLNGCIPVRDFASQAWEPQSVKWPPQTKRLEALGKLEFATHVFPLLERLNGRPLEEVFSVDDIEGLQSKPAEAVDQYLLYVDGLYRRHTKSLPSQRAQTDPELLCYECHINPKGKCIFKASVNKQGSTVVQRTLGFDRVLQVFLEDCSQFECYKDILKDGIFAGPRVYQYFVHKDDDDDDEDKSAQEEKRNTKATVKCYFVCTDSTREKDWNDRRFRKFHTILEVRSLFMHVHTIPTVSNYIARLQLCLSKTMTITGISFSDLVIEEMEDLPSKDKANLKALFTDGTGFMSTDVARLMPRSIFEGTQSEKGQKNELREDYPTLVQIRFFHEGAAYKGTLLANKDLRHNTIKFYNSMKKVQSDPLMSRFSISSFELVSTSRCPRRAKLSRDLIVLLSIGGVDESVFLDALRDATEHVLIILRDRNRAHQELEWEGANDLVDITRHMLRTGIPMEEPGLQQNLIHLIKNKFKDFAKGRVPLDGTFYLMGTADPTGTLKPNEVAISEGGRQVIGPMISYRAPGKHPGDPHKLEAVYSKALHDIVGGDKNAIFFSTQGTRPLTHEIAKGDLDEDLYWICENKKVVEQFHEWLPRWSPGEVKFRPGKGQNSPLNYSPAELEDALIDEYLNERFNKSKVVGAASMRWLTHVDAFLHPETSPLDKEIHKSECLKYPDYIYEDVDSTKSGKQVQLFQEHKILRRYSAPYLWKKEKKHQNVEVGTGIRKSTLEKMYDLETEQEARMGPPLGRGSERHREIWERNFKHYNAEMARACESLNLDPDGPKRVYKRWRMILYGAPSFHEMEKKRQIVFEEASAIYQVVYRAVAQNIDLGKAPAVAFAWNVAGVALGWIYADKQPKETVGFSDGAFNEIYKKSKSSVSDPRRASHR